MKIASLNEIKKELETLHPSVLLKICVQLVKYKKENKELINYLLFESDNEETYINTIKQGIDEEFDIIKKSNLYIAKKQIRKSLRNTNKFIKYSGDKRTEVELRIYFCLKLRKLPSSYLKQAAIAAILVRQVTLTRKAIDTLHEDLQFDYGEELKKVTDY
jgi:hypothetical protein